MFIAYKDKRHGGKRYCFDIAAAAAAATARSSATANPPNFDCLRIRTHTFESSLSRTRNMMRMVQLYTLRPLLAV